MTQTPINRDERWIRWDKRIRDTVLFVLGLAGVINELFIKPEPQPYSLIFLGSLLGLPFVLHADEKRRNNKSSSSDLADQMLKLSKELENDEDKS